MGSWKDSAPKVESESVLGASPLEIKVSLRAIEQSDTLNVNRIKTLTKRFPVEPGVTAAANWPVRPPSSPFAGVRGVHDQRGGTGSATQVARAAAGVTLPAQRCRAVTGCPEGPPPSWGRHRDRGPSSSREPLSVGLRAP